MMATNISDNSNLPALREMGKTLKGEGESSVFPAPTPLPSPMNPGDRLRARRKSHHLSLMNVASELVEYRNANFVDSQT